MKRAAVLSGERGAGKTTLCMSLAEKLRNVGGIACPAVFDPAGDKTGFHCVCLHSGERWELGSVDGSANCGDATRRTGTGKYLFDEAGISKSLACIRESLEKRNWITLIDEIGPLEIEQGEGFAPVLPLLPKAGDLLLVVRPLLIEEIGDYLRNHQSKVFQLTVENRATLIDEIIRFFAGS